MALVTKGSALLYSGHRREGLALLEGAVADAVAHGQHMAALRGGNNLASGTADTIPASVLERVREGMALSRRLGLRSFDGYHAGNASSLAERLGEWDWVRDALDELFELDPDRVEAPWIALCRDSFSAWIGGPDIDRAERLLELALAEQDFQSELNLTGWLGRCAFAVGDAPKALRLSAPYFRYVDSDAGLSEFAMVGRFALHAGDRDAATRVLGASAPGSVGSSITTGWCCRPGWPRSMAGRPMRSRFIGRALVAIARPVAGLT